jgi:BMFP domain-containing protein YqiC
LGWRDGIEPYPPDTKTGEFTVVDPKIIDDLAKRLADSLPDSLRALQTDVDQNFRAVLQAGIAKLDLVSREEFDVQQSVLRRTRERLEALEARLASIEEAGREEDPAD